MKNKEDKKRRFRFKLKLPSVFFILLTITLIIIIVSWIPGTTENGGAGILDLFLAPIKGFGQKWEIIIFILILGGFLWIVIQTKALDAGIGRLVAKMNGKEIILIPIIITLFAIGGSTYGMGEETIALYPVLIPVFIAAGFDGMTAVLTILLGAGVGCLASTVNPFVINPALDAFTGHEVSSTGGIVWRTIILIVFIIVASIYVIIYAKRVRKDNTKSVIYDIKDEYEREFALSTELPEYNGKRKAIMAIFMITFTVMIICLIGWADFFGKQKFEDVKEWWNENLFFISRFINMPGLWSLLDVAVLFFISGLICAMIAFPWKKIERESEDQTLEKTFFKDLIAGASDILSVCMVIAFAAGISWLLEETGMSDVLVDSLAEPMKNLNSIAFVIITFFISAIVGLLVTSTSGAAGLLFGTLGPIILASGLENSIAGSVTAFSLSTGIVNIFSPTSGILMAALTISKIDYGRFIKVSWPLMIVMPILAIIMLAIGGVLPYQSWLF